jgi:FKBP-type peptidyl-prolyl cis-trans isomerase FklB
MRIGRMALLVAILLSVGGAPGEPAAEDAEDRASYSLGHQIGSDLAREGREIDLEALRQGLRDGLSGAVPALPEAELHELLSGLKRSLETRESRLERARRYREEGEAFLAANAAREGVISLPSGLQYRVIEPGHGRSPGPTERVRVHYRATLADGTAFHDSRWGGGGPETLQLGGVIAGLGEALQRMREGARWEIFIPPDLAYGRRGPLADRTVVYDLELLSIEPGT